VLGANKEVQARAGTSAGLGSQMREKGNVPAVALTTDEHVCGRCCCGAEHTRGQRVNLARYRPLLGIVTPTTSILDGTWKIPAVAIAAADGSKEKPGTN
jgi:hypothetical protein